MALGLVLVLGALVKEPEILLPIGPDQGTYSYVAERILAGGLPYVDAWDNKPPATYYAHAAVLALVPAPDRWSRSCLPDVQQECGYLALQLADVAWTSLTGLAVLLLAQSLGLSRGTAVVACGLFVVFANLSQLSREGSTPEKQLLLPMVLAYLAVLRGGRRWLFVAGVFAGLAFLFKQTAISIPVALVAWWALQRLKAVRAFGHQGALRPPGPPAENPSAGDPSPGDLSAGNVSARDLSAGHLSAGGLSAGNVSARDLSAGHVSAGNVSARDLSAGGLSAGDLSARPAWFAAGWLVPIGVTVAFFAARGALGPAWEASFGYNLTQAGSSALAIPRGALSGAWHVFANSSALLWLLGLGGFLLLASKRARPGALLGCWAIADALSLCLGGAKFAQVYFVQLVPSLALLAAVAVAEGWRLTRGMPMLRAYAGIVGLAIFLLSNQFEASVALRAFWERTPPHASVPLERVLAGRFPTGQPLFVWGDNTEIYLYANAQSPSRFFHTFPLSHQYTAGTGYLERRAELLRAWQARPPQVVAIDPATARDDPDASLGLNVSSFPELVAILTREYVPMADVPGGWQAYRRR